MTDEVLSANSCDRRGPRRQRVLLPCCIMYGATSMSVQGSVRDLHDKGAFVRLSAQIALPKRVSVLIGRDGAAYDAEIAWRRGADLGLRFLSTVDIADATDQHIRILRQLWLAMAGRSSSADLAEDVVRTTIRVLTG